jgi:hypothetical protein
MVPGDGGGDLAERRRVKRAKVRADPVAHTLVERVNVAPSRHLHSACVFRPRADVQADRKPSALHGRLRTHHDGAYSM